MPWSTCIEGNEQGDRDRHEQKDNQPDKPTPPPQSASLFEQRLRCSRAAVRKRLVNVGVLFVEDLHAIGPEIGDGLMEGPR
jgi:hypothetical protein